MFKTTNVKNLFITSLFISALLLSGCIGENNSNDDNDVDIIIKEGDIVELKYVARYNYNRTIFDTSDEEIAKNYQIYNSSKNYGYLKIFVNPNDTIRKPSGFDNYLSNPTPNLADEIIGMKKNEINNFTIPYDEAYNLWDVELAEFHGISPYPINSYINKNRIMQYSNFSKIFQNLSINIGTIFDWGIKMIGKSDIVSAKITNIINNNTGKYIEYELEPIIGSNFSTPFNWTATIINQNDTHFMYKTKADIGYYVVLANESGNLNFKVVDKNETHLTIGLNADELDLNRITLEIFFAVEIVDIIRF
jgi:hypothetical protein